MSTDLRHHAYVSSWYQELLLQGFVVLDERSTADVGRRLGRSGLPHLLTPRDRAAAKEWSLSGVYGLGPFPWHTDGAVSSTPPRWLLLRAIQVSARTATELLEPDSDVLAAMRQTVLRVTDRAGQVHYAPAALPHGDQWQLRWDPRVGSPRGALTGQKMEQQLPTAVIEWKEQRILVVDNARLLHRRPAVDGSAQRILERIYIWEK